MKLHLVAEDPISSFRIQNVLLRGCGFSPLRLKCLEAEKLSKVNYRIVNGNFPLAKQEVAGIGLQT